MAGEKIALLISSNDAPYKAAVSGFNTYLAKQGVQAGYEVYALDGDAAKAGPAIQKIKASGSRLIFALGSLATDAVVKEVADIPIVACLVLRTDSLKNVPNVTGVGLEFSLRRSWSGSSVYCRRQRASVSFIIPKRIRSGSSMPPGLPKRPDCTSRPRRSVRPRTFLPH